MPRPPLGGPILGVGVPVLGPRSTTAVMAAAVAAATATAQTAIARPSTAFALSPPVLQFLPPTELRDVDCDSVRGTLVDWTRLKALVKAVDKQWQNYREIPQQACEFVRVEDADSDAHVVLSRAADAAEECAIGAISAVLVLLFCVMECAVEVTGGVVGIFEKLWRDLLIGDAALPVYMLGTSSWPVASLLAKWQTHCAWSPDSVVRSQHTGAPFCHRNEVTEFEKGVCGALVDQVLPILWRPAALPGSQFALGTFTMSILPTLARFLNSDAASASEMPLTCPATAAVQGTILMLLRMLGPPSARDPLHGDRLAELGGIFARMTFAELLGGGCSSRAAVVLVAVASQLAHRSHSVSVDEVPVAEVRRVLELAASLAADSRGDSKQVADVSAGIAPGARSATATPTPAPAPEGAIGSSPETSLVSDGRKEASGISTPLGGTTTAPEGLQRHHRELWRRTGDNVRLGGLWRQVARWLLVGKVSAPRFAYVTMGFGDIDAGILRGFLLRAVDVGLPRLIFVTPDSHWFLLCEEVRWERGAESALLCVRSFSASTKPYDVHNKGKFFVFPVLLALGVDAAWLDLDIFVIRNPTRRLLQLANEGPRPPADVLAIDHFDEYCLGQSFFMVRATDRSLVWLLQYIRWLYWYPFGHDQNGWDSFLGHSVVEPQVPEDLRSNEFTNASYRMLSTELEFASLSGWAGDASLRGSALLLHFSSTRPIPPQAKRLQLLGLFNATGRRATETVPNERRVQSATWKVLRSLQASMPISKRPCYRGALDSVSKLHKSGFYEELLA
eukprot:TRINITY_DN40926_c0_g1_i1.p1 TRINITY_DN40926_c0_g1~~TRINITY_DN40926_c0_g1_i1.p1  ORF type:complete len:790 (-),score=113.16 TRINITY_DN40926_c0_g1_i1:137-2506(-)